MYKTDSGCLQETGCLTGRKREIPVVVNVTERLCGVPKLEGMGVSIREIVGVCERLRVWWQERDTYLLMVCGYKCER